LFDVGEIIDNKYRVDGLCSDSGGMGSILFVTPLGEGLPSKVVLKYCKDNSEEQIKRFRREVRILGSFHGNSKVVQIVDQNLDHNPPYFVMKYYQDGDLTGLSESLQSSYEVSEKCFLQMIDCVQELHSKNEFHRDIKPQNFLREGEQIVVSDFGLSMEVGSDTAFTRSSVFWGTHGYIPPEFLHGGFKHADAMGDIFMLGKTMYVLLTGRDPMYLMADDVPVPLFHVIERCCAMAKTSRYRTLAELKQSLVAAYDVLLGRAEGIGKVKQLLSVIKDRLEQENKYSAAEVAEFVEQLGLLDEKDQALVCYELPRHFFSAISQKPLAERLPEFLRIYEKLVEGRDYSWSYAETIASHMRTVFAQDGVPPGEKAVALDLAIRAAYYMNRFAAMDTCRSMVASVRDDTLGLHVASVLLKNRHTFISDLEVSQCQSEPIRIALRQMQRPQGTSELEN